MQTNIPEWKPSRKEKEVNDEPIPMYQALPPEAQPDPLFQKHFLLAETGRLKDEVNDLKEKTKAVEAKQDLDAKERKAKGEKPYERSDAHQAPIIHDDEDVPKYRAEFDEMKRIYTVIRQGALERLIAINDALRNFNLAQSGSMTQSANPDQDSKKALEAYEKATADFEKFCSELDNPHAEGRDPKEFTNGVTLKWASIQPKVVEGGFIRGAKVIVRWAGGSHISSDSLP